MELCARIATTHMNTAFRFFHSLVFVVVNVKFLRKYALILEELVSTRPVEAVFLFLIMLLLFALNVAAV